MNDSDELSGPVPVLDQQVDELLSKLNLKEKVALLSGQDAWKTTAIPQVGIPSLTVTDGPHGVRTPPNEGGRIFGPATAFPTGIAMAATWNPALIERAGVALGEETLAMGCDILLGPDINIIRTPLAGRNFETYSEDPYLAGKIGAAWVRGVQSQNVGASVKHYAANNQEFERNRGSSIVDERTLREIYLPAFETIVKETDPWTVMCSYNRINGVYASQHEYLLKDILKGEWAFPGVVISDWGANHTTAESVAAGLDLEMPGPAKYYGELLREAVEYWQIDEEKINEAARRILRMVLRSGKMDSNQQRPKGSVNTPEHQALACELARESITLLKNERRVLPLDAALLTSLAVIGPNAKDMVISGGGSAYVEPPYRVSPLEALQEALGQQVKISFEEGSGNFTEMPVITERNLQPANQKGKEGLWAEYFANTEFSDQPVLERVEQTVRFWRWGGNPDDPIPSNYSARWTGSLVTETSGTHTLAAAASGVCRVFLEDRLLIEILPDPMANVTQIERQAVEIDLEAGHAYSFKVEHIKSEEEGFSHVKLMLGWTPRPEDDQRLEQAIQLAKKSDVALVFAGTPEDYETEGVDRPHMELPSRQNELIREVARANPNTVVILNIGSPVSMPWLSEVAAVVLMYFPGMEGGHALAEILTGGENPSGRLPVTFPIRLEDNPTYLYYPGDRQVQYGEGIFVGYRYYDKKDIDPLFPFGFGLSYTTFTYSQPQIPEEVNVGEKVMISVKVTNTGKRAGKEVVQLYIRDLHASLIRPLKELKGFQKVELAVGESKTVHFELDLRALSFYDPDRREWVAEPGEFEVLLGSSSRHIHSRGAFVLRNL